MIRLLVTLVIFAEAWAVVTLLAMWQIAEVPLKIR